MNTLAACLALVAALLGYDLARDWSARRRPALRIVYRTHAMVFVRGRDRRTLYLTPRTFPPTDFLN